MAHHLDGAEDVNIDTSRKTKTVDQKLGEIDPTLPAKRHGHKPSRGAEIDKEIAEEEAEMIARKEAKKQ